jgi:2-amino-4-hydroxy-6-hydroxymethyldihydropteridine diphosphokinase
MRNAGWVIRAESRLYATPAFPPGSGPEFVNAAISVETQSSPSEILTVLHWIEAALDRQRMQRWSQRTIDLDLIAVDDVLLPDPATHQHWRDLPLARQMQDTPDDLILPHPRLQDRPFVLVPLADIAPDWVHPALGTSVLQMLRALPQEAIKDVKVLQ